MDSLKIGPTNFCIWLAVFLILLYLFLIIFWCVVVKEKNDLEMDTIAVDVGFFQ